MLRNYDPLPWSPWPSPSRALMLCPSESVAESELEQILEAASPEKLEAARSRMREAGETRLRAAEGLLRDPGTTVISALFWNYRSFATDATAWVAACVVAGAPAPEQGLRARMSPRPPESEVLDGDPVLYALTSNADSEHFSPFLLCSWAARYVRPGPRSERLVGAIFRGSWEAFLDSLSRISEGREKRVSTLRELDPLRSAIKKERALEHLAKYRDATLCSGGDKSVYRAGAYRTAMESIRRLPGLPSDRESLSQIEGVGKSISEKLEQLFKTPLNSPPPLEEKLLSGSELCSIRGFGPSTVAKLLGRGLDSPEKVLRAYDSGDIELTQTQLWHLRNRELTRERVPRETATALLGELERRGFPYRFEVAGSYRRGSETVGDLDLLVTDDRWDTRADLERSGHAALDRITDWFLSNDLVVRGFPVPSGGKVARTLYVSFDGRAIQVDIRLTPADERVAALAYFTGSKSTNIRMRATARRMGLLLNEKGLFALPEDDPESLEGRRIWLPSERVLWWVLGIPYRSPEDR